MSERTQRNTASRVPHTSLGDTPVRVTSLESIRGLAAFIVLIGHLIFAFAPWMHFKDRAELEGHGDFSRVLASTPLAVLYNGQFCVTVFFVLSGVVLSYSYFASGGETAPTSAACRRYLRLMLPIAFCAVCSYALLQCRLTYHEAAANAMYRSGAISQRGYNWLLNTITARPSLWHAAQEGLLGALVNHDRAATFNCVLWTMQVEFLGSYFVFGFLALFGSLRNRWFLYSALALSLLYLRQLYLLDFLAGIALCDFYTGHRRISVSGLLAWPMIMAGLALGGVRFPLAQAIRLPVLSNVDLLNTIGAILLIASALYSPGLQRLLARPAARFLGRISFSLYLLHVPVLCSVGCWTYLHVILIADHVAAAFVASAVTIALTVSASWLATVCVDEPAVALGKALYAWLLAPSTRSLKAECSPRHSGLLGESHVDNPNALPQSSQANDEQTKRPFALTRRIFVRSATVVTMVSALGLASRKRGPTSRQLAIHTPHQGAVLNHRHGQHTVDGLTVYVDGDAPADSRVVVNGIPAEQFDNRFRLRVTLRDAEPDIIAIAEGPNGRHEDRIRCVWDRHSQPRYRLAIDDNIFFLRDIAEKRYRSLFECFYLEILRNLHRKYGVKVALNLYYTTGDGFSLPMFPDRYKSEWRDNSDWLTLAFHALADKPDRPYEDAVPERLIADLDLVAEQIHRFAGDQSYSPPTVIHFGSVSHTAFRPLANRGVRVLSGYFRRTNDVWDASYSWDDRHSEYLSRHDAWKDFSSGIVFSRVDMVCNTVPVERIEFGLEQCSNDPNTAEIMDLLTHEQYFWPFYRSYLSDHASRLELALRWVTERGYKPVFFHEGLLGGPI